MKLLVPQLYHLLRRRPTRMNILSLLRFLLFLSLMVTVYSMAFHYIMNYEGREGYSWITGFYWTLTVMSTLGFGDITFQSDLGRLFSSVVLLSGIVFLLVLLPFSFIEFFYEPWLKAQAEARAPRKLPEKTRGHVILTQFDAVTHALIDRLVKHHYPYALLAPDLDEALRLHDLGYHVVVGDLDNPDTYRLVRVDQALLVATTQNDRVNTNVAFTVREVSETVPIVATANAEDSVDILRLAGCNHVLELAEMMGQSLARRVIGGPHVAHVIGSFDELLIAEAVVDRTPLVGMTLRQSELRKRVGISVLGLWYRGAFETATPETVLEPGAVLVIAGTGEQMNRFDALAKPQPRPDAPVVIIGGGRVGRATAHALSERGFDYRIVEVEPDRIRDDSRYILGDAADLHTIERAGIRKTKAVIVTTHDDDTNIYLTLYFRRLRPEIQIISRSRLERNVATLHRAGADFVMSYSSIGATMMLNLLNRSNILMVAEGLDLIRIKVPHSLAGRTIADADVRRKTGCTIVAIQTNGKTYTNPDPELVLPRDAEMVLIGTEKSEDHLLKEFADELEA